LEGAYSFIVISTLDPEAMYIVKNTGTMVIGFPKSLAQRSDGGTSLRSISEAGSDHEGEEETKDNYKEHSHKFQIVSSDTTVF